MPSQEVRKTVTVLFADVTGSTALGERLDPESLRGVLSRYFEEMRSVIERHGGTVEKFIGDAVMAVFGVPHIHEDDALRAVRAAAEMGQALDSLNEDLDREWGARLQIRTGVNTGVVVAGDSGEGQTLVTGDTVNVAARLEQAAEPGEILLGKETFRLVRDAVAAEPVEPLELKGKAEPVRAHRLRGVTPGAAGFARRLDSPLVGRDQELAAVQTGFEEAAAQRLCRLVTVIGDAGAGKSRLVGEFMAAADATVLTGRCLPYGEGITFWPIAEAIKSFAGITEQDSPEDARSRIGGLLARTEDADLVRDRVVAAIGLGQGGGELQETFWAIRRLLEALAKDRPLILLVEDIHWAEPTLLDLLQYVAGFSSRRSVLLLCTARPELRELRPDWEAATITVGLQPLTEDQSGELIENLLGRTELADEVRGRITEAAEGNPLFVEEMLRMLIDDGLLVRDNGHWRQGGDLSRVAIPGTINALLSARLDRLDSEEQSVIQCASVVGKVFYWGAVASLTPEDVRPRVGPHLQTLLRKELVRPESSAFAGEDAFRFSHILVRDAAYESVPKRIRAELHERFAGWLEERAGQRIAEYEEIVGYHLEQAYHYRAALGPVDPSARELGRRAAGHLASSGRRAFQRGDMRAAVNMLKRAAGLLGGDDRIRPAVLVDLGTALTDVGELGAAADAFSEAVQAAAASGDLSREWQARVQRVWVLGSLDPVRDWRPILAEAKRAINVFEELGDQSGLARAWGVMADFYNDVAKRSEMEHAAAKAVEHARRAGDLREEAMSARLLATALFTGPAPVAEAASRLEEIIRRARTRPMMEVAVLPVLAELYGMQGRFPEGRALLDRGRALQEELGLRFLSARMAVHAGPFELLAGDPAAAERELRRACEIFREMGEKGRFSTTAGWLADALYALGRDEEALLMTEESEQASAPEDVVSQVTWRRVRAKVLARRGESVPAEELSGQALGIAEQSPDDLDIQVQALRDMAEVLRLAGKLAEATSCTERTLALEERKGNVTGAARARALLEELTTEGA